MSDEQDLDAYWFDTRPLTEPETPLVDELRPAKARLRDDWARSRSWKDRLEVVRTADVKGIATEWKTNGPIPTRIERFASANGFNYKHWSGGTPTERLEGMIFRNGGRDHPTTYADLVEFGNFVTQSQDVPHDFGYVAVRHSLGLPHLILDARCNNAEPPNGLSKVYASDENYLSLNVNFRGSNSGTPLGRAKADAALKGIKIEPVDLGDQVTRSFVTFGVAEQLPEARALLTPEAVQFLTWMGEAFDVEITENWIYLYGYQMELVTEDLDMWAWVFSVTSRVIDQVRAWGADVMATGRPAFYTERHIPMPESAWLRRPSPGWRALWETD